MVRRRRPGAPHRLADSRQRINRCANLCAPENDRQNVKYADARRRSSLAMETTSYQPAHDLRVVLPLPEAASNDWRNGLPVLCGSRVLLRELRMSDASALFARLTAEAVSQFISRPPSTVEGFERFIDWTWHQRTAGTYACFAVTVDGDDAAVGIIQVRRAESDFSRAEWGFAIGSEYWGTGAFKESAELVLGFAFDVLGIHRLEARAVLRNGRGNGAL